MPLVPTVMGVVAEVTAIPNHDVGPVEVLKGQVRVESVVTRSALIAAEVLGAAVAHEPHVASREGVSVRFMSRCLVIRTVASSRRSCARKT
jgi:hypothetical protein